MPYDITPAELAVLQALWERGDATVRELTDDVYPGGGTSGYATVQKLLARLEAKDVVARLPSPKRPSRYRARVDRAALIDRRLRDTADALCDGSLTPLLTQLVAAQPFSARDRDELLKLIEKLSKRRKRR